MSTFSCLIQTFSKDPPTFYRYDVEEEQQQEQEQRTTPTIPKQTNERSCLYEITNFKIIRRVRGMRNSLF